MSVSFKVFFLPLLINATLIMSPSDLRRYPSVSNLFYISLILPYVITGPIPADKTFYYKSIQSLVENNCKMPLEIVLPFRPISDPTNFSYLSAPLKECQIDETLKSNEEAHLLCNEIFEVLKNITCSDYNMSLPTIESTRRSKEVCSDFKDMEDVLPLQNKYISGKLVDGMICNILCSDKFDSLCRTLVWSYDVQVRIKNALKPIVTEEGIGDVNNVESKDTKDSKINASNAKQEPVLDEAINEKKEEQNFADADLPITDENKKKSVSELDVKTSVPASPTSKISMAGQTPSSKLDPLVTNNRNPGNLDQITKPIDVVQNQDLDSGSEVTAVSNQQDMPDNVQVDLSQKINDKDVNPAENEVNDKPQQKETKPDLSNKVEVADQKSKSLTSGTVEKIDKNKEISTSTTLDTIKNKSSTTVTNNNQIDEKLENPIPKDNKLNNDDIQEKENKAKVNEISSDTQIPGEADKNKVIEKPKETDSEVLENPKETDSEVLQNPKEADLGIPNKDVFHTDLTAFQTAAGNSADEDQEDKEGDQYYSTLSDLQKPKKTETKNSVVSEAVLLPNDFPGNYADFLNSRSNIRRNPDDIQMVSTFPEQEDSHFFFYFLSIVLILMAGYLIFHNKQKIIALIVEGRHERRRRSHGAGYKKLETK